MDKINKDFFVDNEVLFVGYSGKNQKFSKEIYLAFERNGIKVYPLNSKGNGNYDVQVYKKLEDLPKIPKSAFVLLNKENAGKVIGQLADNGVQKILFQSKKNVDAATIEECKKRGIEAVISCPLMTFGTGIHKIHAFFAGAR